MVMVAPMAKKMEQAILFIISFHFDYKKMEQAILFIISFHFDYKKIVGLSYSKTFWNCVLNNETCPITLPYQKMLCIF